MYFSRSSFFIRENLVCAREPNASTLFVLLSTRIAFGTRAWVSSIGSLRISSLSCRVYATEQEVVPKSIAATNPEAGLKPAALLSTSRVLGTPFGQRESFERAMVAIQLRIIILTVDAFFYGQRTYAYGSAGRHYPGRMIRRSWWAFPPSSSMLYQIKFCTSVVTHRPNQAGNFVMRVTQIHLYTLSLTSECV